LAICFSKSAEIKASLESSRAITTSGACPWNRAQLGDLRALADREAEFFQTLFKNFRMLRLKIGNVR
jgi:hypothetical protein